MSFRRCRNLPHRHDAAACRSCRTGIRMRRKKSPPKRDEADKYPNVMRGRNAASDRIGLKNPPSIRFDRRENPACSVSDTSVFGIEQKADIDMKKMWGVSTLTL